jgi:hypothetical protein
VHGVLREAERPKLLCENAHKNGCGSALAPAFLTLDACPTGPDWGLNVRLSTWVTG